MTERISLRPPRDSDVPRLVELYNDGALELGEPPNVTAADVTVDWGFARFDRERHARVALLGARLVGTVGLWPRGDFAMMDGTVERGARGRGVGTAMLQWGVRAARAEDGVRFVDVAAPAKRSDAIALIESHAGFEHVRTFYTMVHPEPTAVPASVWPDGVAIVPMRGEELARAAVEAHDGSFIDHWNFTPVPLGDYMNWMTGDPENDPDLWLIAARAGEIAGYCLCSLEGKGDDRRGYVGQLGTTRPFRGIGLGRALLLEGIRRLAARGSRAVELGVDAQNPTGALQLYRSTGFEVARENPRYRLLL